MFIGKKNPYFFLVRFIAIFLLLYYFFPFYRGLIGQGGILYSAYLENHFNLIIGLTKLLTGSAKWVLETIGYSIVQKNYHSLRVEHFRGISVNPSCLGWGVMSFWIAFTIASAGTLPFKLKWAFAGLLILMSLNIFRIVLIVIANFRQWNIITSLDPHQTFNIFSYACIFILIIFFTRIQKKYENIEFKNNFLDEHAITGI